MAATTSVVGDYWTPLIVRELLHGTVRFNQIARNLPSISRSLLSDRLRKLERLGVIVREGEQPGRSSYALTPSGRDLQLVVDAMTAWGMQWGNRNANPEALDPTLTICMMKSRMRHDGLEGRVVIEVIATGEGEGRAWLVCDEHGVSICFDPPNFDVDLWVRGSARTFYGVWLQIETMGAALGRGGVAVEGPPPLIRRFRRWFDAP